MEVIKKYINHSTTKNKLYLFIISLFFLFFFFLIFSLLTKPSDFHIKEKFLVHAPKPMVYEFLTQKKHILRFSPWITPSVKTTLTKDSLSGKTMYRLTDNKEKKSSFIITTETPYKYVSGIEKSGNFILKHEWILQYITDTLTSLEWNINGNLPPFFLNPNLLKNNITNKIKQKFKVINAEISKEIKDISINALGDTILENKLFVGLETVTKKSQLLSSWDQTIPEVIMYAIRNGFYNKKEKSFILYDNENKEYIRYKTGIFVHSPPPDLEHKFIIDSISPGHYFIFSYQGTYSLFPYVYSKIDEYLINHHMLRDTNRPYIIQFIKSHVKHPDPSQWVTLFYVPLKDN